MSFWADIRSGLRQAQRHPGTTAVAVGTLGLALGASTAIFSICDAVLFRPLRYTAATELVAVFTHETQLGETRNPTSPANYLDWKAASESLDHLTAAHPWSPVLTGTEGAHQLAGLKATPDLFGLLRVEPARGRTFQPGDGPGVVVLGDGLWKRRFGADPAVVGRSLQLDGEAYTVIGVMPPGFRFPPFWATDAELWAPRLFTQDEASQRNASFLRVFGRLRPGRTADEAQRELDVVTQRLETAHPDANRGIRASVEPLLEPVVGPARQALGLLATAVLLVLLIACLNVANLRLALATAREQEAAVRVALGAARGRLVRQALIEGLVWSVAGGVLGLLIAHWTVPAMALLAGDSLPRLDEVAVDGRVLAFGMALALLSTGIFTILPAWRASRMDPARVLHGARTTRGREARRAAAVLVVAEFALAGTLVATAGLLTRTLLSVLSAEPGFEARGVVALSLSLPRHEARSSAELAASLVERAERIPGVIAAATVNHLPIAGDTWRSRYLPEGRTDVVPGEEPRAVVRVATAGYFRALGQRIVAGRDFDAMDVTEGAPVAIVNQAFAQREWPGAPAVGKRVDMGGGPEGPAWISVVGVVADATQDDPTHPVVPEIVRPYTQDPTAWWHGTTLVLRSDRDSATLLREARGVVSEVDARMAVAWERRLVDVLAEAAGRQRLHAWVLSLLGGCGLLLAAVGAFGVLRQAVGGRSRELAIRTALGARPRTLVALVLREGLGLGLAGAALGVLGALAAGRLLEALLFGVRADDPLTLAIAPGILAAAALLASLEPAWRASRVDPVVSLRND